MAGQEEEDLGGRRCSHSRIFLTYDRPSFRRSPRPIPPTFSKMITDLSQGGKRREGGGLFGSRKRGRRGRLWARV